MARLLKQVEERLDLILKGGRGSDGSLGSDAQARALPANYLRKSADGAALIDPSYSLNSLDCSYFIEWEGFDHSEVYNTTSSLELHRAFCSLYVGFVAGDAHTAFVKANGSEVKATVARQAMARATEYSVLIMRALRFGALYIGGTDPAISLIDLNGRTSNSNQFDRVIVQIPLAVSLDVSNVIAYTPGET